MAVKGRSKLLYQRPHNYFRRAALPRGSRTEYVREKRGLAAH